MPACGPFPWAVNVLGWCFSVLTMECQTPAQLKLNSFLGSKVVGFLAFFCLGIELVRCSERNRVAPGRTTRGAARRSQRQMF